MDEFNIIENKLIKYNGSGSTIVTPEVEVIASHAFKGVSNLKAIVISDSVKVIEDKAFECCYDLERIQLPSDLRSLGHGAFNNCHKLKEISIPEGVFEIPDYCFFACSKLESVNFPNSLVRIGKGAFDSCALKEIILPEGVTEIGDSAFSKCWKLTAVSLPSSLKKIGSLAFAYCKYLPTSTLSIHPETEVDKSTFNGCCKIGYRVVKLLVECEYENHCFSDEIETEVDGLDTIADIAVELIHSVVAEEFEDIIDAAMNQYEPALMGKYDVYSETEALYSAARKYLDETTSGCFVMIKAINDENVVLETISIALNVMLKAAIDDRYESEASYCDVGSLIENALSDFIDQGRWHCGLMNDNSILVNNALWPQPLVINETVFWNDRGKEYVPVIWFGNADEPMKPWMIYPGMNASEKEFWFEADENDVMHAVVEESDGAFMCWYLYECGRDVPDVNSVLERCPIKFTYDETEETIQKKLNAHFMGIKTTS